MESTVKSQTEKGLETEKFFSGSAREPFTRKSGRLRMDDWAAWMDQEIKHEDYFLRNR